jgi:CheY-like chemotaxis protein
MTATILVVDDAPYFARVMEINLRMWGYTVLTAYDGEAALQQVRHNSDISVVLSDLEMPRLDGIGLIFRLREEQPDRKIPVIIMTGRDLTLEDAQTALYAGAYSLLAKPFRPADLQAIVDKAAGVVRQKPVELVQSVQLYG